MALEQDALEMSQDYETKIKKIKQKDEADIHALVKEFTNNLKKVQDEFDISQVTANNLTVYYRDKLDGQEIRHDDVIDDTIEDARLVQIKLKNQWTDAENQEAQKKIAKREAEIRMDEAKSDYARAKRRREQTEAELYGLTKQIESLKEENDEVEEKLRKRETDLYKYRFKIKDLNKSK